MQTEQMRQDEKAHRELLGRKIIEVAAQVCVGRPSFKARLMSSTFFTRDIG